MALKTTSAPFSPGGGVRLPASFSHSLELLLTQSFTFIHEDYDVEQTFLNLAKRYFDKACDSEFLQSLTRQRAQESRHPQRDRGLGGGEFPNSLMRLIPTWSSFLQIISCSKVPGHKALPSPPLPRARGSAPPKPGLSMPGSFLPLLGQPVGNAR